MVVMARADDKLREQEIDLIVAVYHRLVGQPLDRSMVTELFEQLPSGPPNQLFDNLAMFENLDMHTKKLIIKSCYLIQVSDREVAKVELETLAALAAALDISEDYFLEILHEVSPH